MMGGIYGGSIRNSDRFFSRESDLSAEIQRISEEVLGPGGVFSLFGDKIYNPTGYIKSANNVHKKLSAAFIAQNPAVVSRLVAEDKAKTHLRGSIEHLNKDVKFNRLLHDHLKVKQLSQNKLNVRVMTLPVMCFMNDCKTALNGNQVSKLFEVDPPSLDEYIAGLLALV